MVDMFNTLRAQPLYNPLLITVVEILLLSKTHLRVFHVPGDENIVADGLSCSRYDSVFHLVPIPDMLQAARMSYLEPRASRTCLSACSRKRH